MKPLRILIAALVLAGLGSLLWQGRSRFRQEPAEGPVLLRHPDAQLTIAAAGDTLVGERFSTNRLGQNDDGVAGILRGASLAVTDLDQLLVDEPGGASGSGSRSGWPAGGPELAAQLRRLGFTFVTLANDHAGVDGGDGLARATRILASAGLAHAGAAADLAAARAAVVLGTAPRRVALIAVATSVPPAARATPRRGDVAGRPGVSTLRYTAVVTADPQTFAALSQIAEASAAEGATPSALTLSGTTIKRGAATAVELVPDAQDLSEILAAITLAQKDAEVVVVSLHSHEPGNRAEAAAPFVQAFARQAIDAGAALVIGHGPRQLRGVEIYRGGAILYSLGSFAFTPSQIRGSSYNVFDTDVSAYDLALNAVQHPEQLTLPTYQEPVWWESAIATATFDGPALTGIKLLPIELGPQAADADRGTPRLAGGEVGQAILHRLDRLSQPFGTRIVIQGGAGLIEIPAGEKSQHAPER
jgi:poly-gamma-glutamate capsule biosynthesis protein CapA/YwtB (metallophosphatase superfamily)